MAEAGSKAQLQRAFEMLKEKNVKKLVLHGEPGVGKTWMARKLSHKAMKEKLFDLTLWLSLKREHNFPDLLWRIARQIFILPVSSDFESQASAESLTEMKDRNVLSREALEGKSVLFVMEDDEGSDDKLIFHELKDILHLDGLHKFIIVSTGERDVDVPGLMGITEMMKVHSLSEDESLSVVEELVGKKIVEVPRIAKLASFFLGKSKRLPYEAKVIGRALRYFEQNESELRMLENVKKENENADHYNVLNLLSYVNGIFPRNVVMDCCCVGNEFVRKRGNVYYNELINYWILEGYLGKFDSMEDAYNVGHSVLMELIDCGIIRQMEPGCISFTSDACGKYQASRRDYMDFVETTKLGLGLADVVDGDLGRTAMGEGIIKGGGLGFHGQNVVSTLILDLDHLNNEVLNDSEFSRLRQDLQLLAIFYPEFHLFPLTSSEMHKFRVLVLRGCEFEHLESIEQIVQLNPPLPWVSGLTVLEISGPNMSLKSLPDDFFNDLSILKSLNLSFLGIESLPSSICALGQLVWLILRQCSNLQELQSLKMCKKLEVLDLSGSSSLKLIHDRSFSSNKALRILNLSGTRLENLPVLRGLAKLTHLLLRECSHLERLRKVTPLSSLEILDLSGSTRFEEFIDPSFVKLPQLQVLDVSRTSVAVLPVDIISLCELRANGCMKLKELPFSDPIGGLQVLDLSGCHNFEHIPNGFFSQLKSLKELNLSNTNIKNIPSISDLHFLLILSLSRCSALESLGELQCAKKLEILDLSGCESLREIQEKSLEHMIRLRKLDLSGTKIAHLPHLPSLDLIQLILKNCSNLENFPSFGHPSSLQELNLSGAISVKSVHPDLEQMTNLHFLDLSETRIESLPSLSNLKNLKNLSLRDCHSLSEIPGFEALSSLNVLDLSGTSVKDLPSLKNFDNLKRLLLRGCLGLEKFRKLEILEALSSDHKELPYDISTLTSLEQLEPPVFGGKSSTQIGEWSISNWPKQAVRSNGLTITLSSFEILQFLQENPTIWDQFHILVHPVDAFGKFGDKRYYKNELFLKDLYLTREGISKCLDIRGFDVFPDSLGLILDRAEFAVLVDNPILTSLFMFKKLKGCWIERCNEMENAECLDMEILRVSHAPKLKNIYSSGNLKSLFLEHCPEISAIGPDSDHFKSLETLEVRFCDKIVSFSGSFPKLGTLKLWGLPELRNLSGCDFPSLENLEIGECPMIVQLFSSADRFPEGLKCLEIKFCDRLSGVFEPSSGRTVVDLQRLCLWELPEIIGIGATIPEQCKRVIQGCSKLS